MPGSECSCGFESIGAAVEPERPGLACFDARWLLRLYGGGAAVTGESTQLDGVITAARRAVQAPARFGGLLRRGSPPSLPLHGRGSGDR